MTVALSSLRVAAELDSSKYQSGARAIDTANASMSASAGKVGGAMKAIDTAAAVSSGSLGKLTRTYVAGAAETAKFEGALRSLNRGIETGNISTAQAAPIIQGIIAKYGTMASAAELVEKGQASLAAVVEQLNIGMVGQGAAATALGVDLDQLRARYVPLVAAEQRHAAAVTEIMEAHRLGALSVKEMNTAIEAEDLALRGNTVAVETNGAAHEVATGQVLAMTHATRSMAEQMAMGVDPMRAMVGQLGHLSFAASGPGGLIGTFKGVGAALGSLLSLENLLTFGVIALATEGVSWLVGMVTHGTEANDVLKDQKTTLDDIVKGYKDVGEAADKARAEALKLPLPAAQSDLGTSLKDQTAALTSQFDPQAALVRKDIQDTIDELQALQSVSTQLGGGPDIYAPVLKQVEALKALVLTAGSSPKDIDAATSAIARLKETTDTPVVRQLADDVDKFTKELTTAQAQITATRVAWEQLRLGGGTSIAGGALDAEVAALKRFNAEIDKLNAQAKQNAFDHAISGLTDYQKGLAKAAESAGLVDEAIKLLHDSVGKPISLAGFGGLISELDQLIAAYQAANAQAAQLAGQKVYHVPDGHGGTTTVVVQDGQQLPGAGPNDGSAPTTTGSSWTYQNGKWVKTNFAAGGWIDGPGTGTSDSVPAMLSTGEFVVNAAIAGQHRGFLEALNSGDINLPRYADGGVVTRSGSMMSAIAGGHPPYPTPAGSVSASNIGDVIGLLHGGYSLGDIGGLEFGPGSTVGTRTTQQFGFPGISVSAGGSSGGGSSGSSVSGIDPGLAAFDAANPDFAARLNAAQYAMGPGMGELANALENYRLAHATHFQQTGGVWSQQQAQAFSWYASQSGVHGFPTATQLRNNFDLSLSGTSISGWHPYPTPKTGGGYVAPDHGPYAQWDYIKNNGKATNTGHISDPWAEHIRNAIQNGQISTNIEFGKGWAPSPWLVDEFGAVAARSQLSGGVEMTGAAANLWLNHLRYGETSSNIENRTLGGFATGGAFGPGTTDSQQVTLFKNPDEMLAVLTGDQRKALGNAMSTREGDVTVNIVFIDDPSRAGDPEFATISRAELKANMAAAMRQAANPRG